jgi:hypothetical protein
MNPERIYFTMTSLFVYLERPVHLSLAQWLCICSNTKPLFLLSLLGVLTQEIREQQTDTVLYRVVLLVARQEHYQKKKSSWCNPVVAPVPAPSREQESEQRDTVPSSARQEHGLEEISSWGDPVAPVLVALRELKIEVPGIDTSRQHDGQDEIFREA